MGTGFEQGSVFHLQGNLVDHGQLSACADLLMTTSPNVMVSAALDGWRRQMAQRGHTQLDATLQHAERVRREVEALPGLHVLREEFPSAEASHGLDPLLADDDETAARLLSALAVLTHAAVGMRRAAKSTCRALANLTSSRDAPGEAFFAAKEAVPADKASGHIAAEQITPYPPGIPVIIPGERITAPLIKYLTSAWPPGCSYPTRPTRACTPYESSPRIERPSQAQPARISGFSLMCSLGEWAPHALDGLLAWPDG
jgi:arginine decarboxylase